MRDIWQFSVLWKNKKKNACRRINQARIPRSICSSSTDTRDKPGHIRPVVHQAEFRMLLDIIIIQATAIIEQFLIKDQHLTKWRNSFFNLNLSLDTINCFRSFYFKSNGLTIFLVFTKICILQQRHGTMRSIDFL